MSGFLSFISWLWLIALIVGLISPKTIFKKSKNPSRIAVLFVFGIGFFFFSMIASEQKSAEAPSLQATNTKPSDSGKKSTLLKIVDAGKKEKTVEQPLTYVSTNFYDFNRDFSPKSNMTDLQKNALFDSKYRNGYVKWRGQVTEVREGFLGGISVHIKHLNTTLVSDVLLEVKPEFESAAAKLKKGQKITYTGKLTSWSTLLAHSVDEGEILK